MDDYAPLGFMNMPQAQPQPQDPQVAQLLARILSNPIGTDRVAGQSMSAADPGFQPGVNWGGSMVSQPFYEGAHNTMSNALGWAAPIKAYHGSPHDFSAFDLSKIGTGEGAQAYGHGLYFAGNSAVADTYKISPNQKTMGPAATWVAKAGGDWRKALDMFNQFTDGLPQTDAQAEVRAALTKGNTPGHMYEVNLNVEPQQLLDWDKPLSGQSQQVQDRLSFLRQAQKVPPLNNVGAETTGGQLHQYLEQRFGDQPTVMDELRGEGIPGIQYLDQGSRAAGEGSRNYVMFDPKLIDILRKYAVPGMVGGGAAAATQPYAPLGWGGQQ